MKEAVVNFGKKLQGKLGNLQLTAIFSRCKNMCLFATGHKTFSLLVFICWLERKIHPIHKIEMPTEPLLFSTSPLSLKSCQPWCNLSGWSVLFIFDKDTLFCVINDWYPRQELQPFISIIPDSVAGNASLNYKQCLFCMILSLFLKQTFCAHWLVHNPKISVFTFQMVKRNLPIRNC